MKNAHRNNFIVEALWQGPLIVLIAIVLSLSVNQFRQGGVPLVRERVSPTPNAGSSEPVKAGEPTITIEEARALFLTNGAVFIDARPEEVYRSGHIQGALNLPPDSPDESLTALMAKVPQDSFIIAYCDGEDCQLSKEAALQLASKGYSNVQVLENGWSAWQDAGLPSER